MKTRIFGMLTFGLLVGLASTTRANFVVDGDFSTPAASPITTLSYGTAFGGPTSSAWTVSAGSLNPNAGSIDILSSTYGNGFVAPPSGQSVDLDGAGPNAAGGITQTLTGLTAGAVYVLSFDYILNYGASVPAKFSVLVGGGTVASLTSSSSAAFTLYTTVFTATSSSTTLTFQSNDVASDQYGALIADVSVVPEPASCAMLGMGVLAIGAFSRIRRRTA